MRNQLKRICSVLLCALLLCTTIPVAFAVNDVPEGYTGVYTIEDLYAIRNTPKQNYILMNDLDLTEATAEGGIFDQNGRGWQPIGSFSGVFDGNGHVIKGLQIGHETNPKPGAAGLFAYVTGTLKNIILENASIISKSGDMCGTLAAQSSGIIENVEIRNLFMTSDSRFTGGVVGSFDGTKLSGCKVSGTITENYDTSKGSPTTTVESTKKYAICHIGGIVGQTTTETLFCRNDATISASLYSDQVSYVGRSYTNYSYYFHGYFYGYLYAGGIAGEATSVNQSFNTGSVSAKMTVTGRDQPDGNYHYAYLYNGGISGMATTISDCYNVGDITIEYASPNTQNIMSGGICGSGSVNGSINIGALTSVSSSVSAISKGTLNSNYYLINTADSGKSGSSDTPTTAVALTESQIAQKSFYGLLDFREKWFLDVSTGINHPQLKANPEGEPHICTYGDEIVTEPTCTEQGFTTHYCSGCANTYVDEYVDPTGHAWDDGIVTTSPTCMTDGVRTYTCLNDTSHTTTEVVPALGHNYVPEITPPTCTAKGYTTYTCARCSDNYKSDQTEPTGHAWDDGTVTTPPSCLKSGVRTFVCLNDSSHTRTQNIPATGHKWNTGEITTDPTCTADGVKTYTCQYDATHTYTEVVPALGHDYHAVVTAPTCTSRGYTTYTCSRCGGSYKTEYTNAIGHKWDDGEVTAEPTCTENGVLTFTCINDPAHTRTEPITKLGHDYDAVATAPTCTEKGFMTYTCARCGDSYKADYVKELGHDFGAWIETTAATCTTDGEEIRYCSRCDATETQPIPATKHQYNGVVTKPTCENQGYTTFTCEKCGNSYVDNYTSALGHSFSEWSETTAPTCTAKGEETRSCSRCDMVETQAIDALGHSFGVWTETTKATCTTDGEETRYCSRCDATQTQPIPATKHQYTAVVTKPTCETKGYTTYTCAKCNDSYTANEVAAFGHAWDDGKITTEPTCTEAGVRTFTCQNDSNHTTTEPVPAKGHATTSVVTSPTCTEMGFTTYTCSVCGYVYTADEVDALGHSFGAWAQTKAPTIYDEGTEIRTCSKCGEKNTRSIQKLPMPKVNIQNFTASSKTYDYRSTITFKADVDNKLPGGQIHWFVDGKDVGTGDTYTAENVKQSFSLQAKYYVDGKEIPEAATDVEKVNVNTGFFAKLKAFFRSLFGLLPKVTQEYLGIEFIDRVLP